LRRLRIKGSRQNTNHHLAKTRLTIGGLIFFKTLYLQ